ncbi:FG-GAP repeat domain-containing protein [Runella sp.]|uniref:FG-GAP repeat domain-containing protein n=1 Tax=Runella sp. TaxID=1960881 RepID=UPI003D1363ED
MTKIIAVGLVLSILIACNTTKESQEQKLAQSYCGGCHLMPTPDLLDKKTWKESVLPQMALRLGVVKQNIGFYQDFSPEEIVALTQANIFPETPIVTQEQWESIVNYYVKNAPDKLPDSSGKFPIAPTLTRFVPKSDAPQIDPFVSLIKFDSATKKLFVGSRRGMVSVFDQKFNRIDSILVSSPPSDLRAYADGSLDILLMGIMDPNDHTKGTLERAKKSADGKTWTLNPVLKKLRRPVNQSFTDVDGDGLEDIVICEYGNYVGQLSWFKQEKDHTYQVFELDPAAGARLVQPYDFNRDGKLDFFVLMAQGDEKLFIIYNRGGGKYEKQLLLRFPPVYGSSYADLADVNGDGWVDIVYSNGDNADYSLILKPYHGVRIFLNNGKNQFEEKWFFPLHGASKALADDFDKDGDIDIAAISYFPSKPQDGFVYFENQGNMKFTAQTFPNPRQDKWMLLEKADYDQDGDNDLLLGYLERPPYTNPMPKGMTGLHILENKTK